MAKRKVVTRRVSGFSMSSQPSVWGGVHLFAKSHHGTVKSTARKNRRLTGRGAAIHKRANKG